MMRWIIASSIKFRRLVIAVAVGVIVFAAVQLDDVRTDTLPEFGPTTVEVQTEALGLSAEEVEQLITVPLEQDLLNGVAFLEDIESVSLPGLSSVIMTFEPGTDVLDARQVVGERLTQAVGVAGLPHVADLPQMIQPLSSTSRVGLVKLTSDDGALTPIDMSILARWQIVPRLLGVEGVANVAIWGFRDRQLQVLVDPATLAERGVTLNDVIRTAGNALEVSTLSYLEASSPGTGGFIDTPNQRLHVFHEQAITGAAELAEVPIESAGPSTATREAGELLTLEDVADVVEDHQPLIGDTACTDGECVLLVVEQFPDANTMEVTEGVEEALATLAPGLSGMRVDTSIYRPADHVEAATGNVARALAIGFALLLIVLALLLPSWRSLVVALVALAASIAAAFVVLHLSGASFDLMLMAGLVAGLLIVIDEATNDADHIARRLSAADATDGAPAWRRVLDAALSMRSSMLYATLIAAAVTVPAFFMRGEAGAFLPPVALAYILAVGAALLVALTVTPALSMMLLPTASATGEPLGVRWARRVRGRTGSIALARPVVAVVVAAVLLVGGLAMVPFIGLDMRPSLQERDIQVDLRAEPGTSLPEMDALTADAVAALEGVDGVDAVAGYVGRAVASDRRVNVNTAQVWLHLAEDADHDEAMASIRALVDGFDGDVQTQVETYSEQRVRETLGGSPHDIAVRVYGEDDAVLQDKSVEIRDAIAGMEGVQTATIETAPTEEAIVVRADIQRAREFGIKPGDVRRTAATLVGGLTVGNLFDEQKVFDAVVWGVPEIRRTPEDIEELLIDAPGGGQVRLGDVATVAVLERPAEIRHESVATYVDVIADVSGRSVGDVAEEVDAAIAQVQFPFEHHAELLGDFAEAQSARTELLFIAIATLIGMFLLLQAAVASWRLAFVVAVVLPLSLVGGMAAVVLSGGDVTLGAVAGFLAVFTFAARAAISSAHAGEALRRGRDATDRSFASDVSTARVRPVLTTVLAAIAVYAPFAVTGMAPGLELLQPLARVVIGGAVTTALVTLLVLPAAFLRFAREPGAEEEEAIEIVTIPEIEAVER